MTFTDQILAQDEIQRETSMFKDKWEKQNVYGISYFK